MVNGWLIGFMDGTTHNHMAADVSVNKKTHGIEVLRRDEDSKTYSVELYPWHTIDFMTTLGTLERK